jgi:hypothetical protein
MVLVSALIAACTSFPVHNVEVSSARLEQRSEEDFAKSLTQLGLSVAAYRPDQDVPVVRFFDEANLLAAAVSNAYYGHYPLKLNPNVIWLTIVQGFGIYVNRNAEALRDKFVAHQGKQTISICRPDFKYQSPLNDWASVFPQFADEIEKRTSQGIRELLECRFSNTSPIDLACSHIALMDVCQSYFDYEIRGECGIPRIDLLGTVDDWRLLRAKTEGLKQFEKAGDDPSRELQHFSRWLSVLLPALDHFVSAAEGHPDTAFWRSICRLDGDCGFDGPTYPGWVAVFFPYIKRGELEPSWYIDRWSRRFEHAKTNDLETVRRDAKVWEGIPKGIPPNDFPQGISRVPVKVTWEDAGLTQELLFHAGVFAIHQHPDGALEPRTGWAVAEAVADQAPPSRRSSSDEEEGSEDEYGPFRELWQRVDF